MRKFSDQLIEACQKVIRKRTGVSISADKAEIYLTAFARLGNLALRFIEMTDKKNKKKTK